MPSPRGGTGLGDQKEAAPHGKQWLPHANHSTYPPPLVPVELHDQNKMVERLRQRRHANGGRQAGVRFEFSCIFQSRNQ